MTNLLKVRNNEREGGKMFWGEKRRKKKNDGKMPQKKKRKNLALAQFSRAFAQSSRANGQSRIGRGFPSFSIELVHDQEISHPLHYPVN